jgi:hypothetical protein
LVLIGTFFAIFSFQVRLSGLEESQGFLFYYVFLFRAVLHFLDGIGHFLGVVPIIKMPVDSQKEKKKGGENVWKLNSQPKFSPKSCVIYK